MKTLFSKILLAQVVTVLLALLVVMLITRVNLERGLAQFVESQEAVMLESAATSLADLYQRRDGWGDLRDNPRAWDRILRQARPADRPGPGPGRLSADDENLPDIAMLQPMERLRMRNRLYLLDETGALVAGVSYSPSKAGNQADVMVEGKLVGRVGFHARGSRLPQNAQRFLRSQVKTLLWSGLITLVLASLLAYLVARHLVRPVQLLDETVKQLSDGCYENHVEVKTNDEIGRLARNVNHLADTLQSNQSARRRWMADIAHELRTPLAILQGEVESLQDGVREVDDRLLASLAEETRQLSKLVDDLQTLALSDIGALNIERQPVDLAVLIETLAEAFRNRLEDKGIALELSLQATREAQVDPDRMRQLFNNLLENCVRYVEPGGQVRLVLFSEAESVGVTMEDSGPGVEENRREQLFERFYRVEPSRTRSAGGSGLGLAICRNIVEAHGGSIQASSSPLGGLRITFSLAG